MILFVADQCKIWLEETFWIDVRMFVNWGEICPKLEEKAPACAKRRGLTTTFTSQL